MGVAMKALGVSSASLPVVNGRARAPSFFDAVGRRGASATPKALPTLPRA